MSWRGVQRGAGAANTSIGILAPLARLEAKAATEHGCSLLSEHDDHAAGVEQRLRHEPPVVAVEPSPLCLHWPRCRTLAPRG